MANPLTTEHFPIPVKVENQNDRPVPVEVKNRELRVSVNDRVEVFNHDNAFSKVETANDGDPGVGGVNPTAIQVGPDENEYLIEFILASISPIVPDRGIWIKVEGLQFDLPLNTTNVQIHVKPNQTVQIGVNIGGTGASSKLYVKWRKLNN